MKKLLLMALKHLPEWCHIFDSMVTQQHTKYQKVIENDTWVLFSVKLIDLEIARENKKK